MPKWLAPIAGATRELMQGRLRAAGRDFIGHAADSAAFSISVEISVACLDQPRPGHASV